MFPLTDNLAVSAQGFRRGANRVRKVRERERERAFLKRVQTLKISSGSLIIFSPIFVEYVVSKILFSLSTFLGTELIWSFSSRWKDMKVRVCMCLTSRLVC